MSKIQEQIQRLQREQLKVELLQKILKSIKQNKDEKFKDVKGDVEKIFERFITRLIQAMEDSVDEEPRKTPPPPAAKTPTKKKPQAVKPQDGSPVDTNTILNFSLDHRHLAGKKVNVFTDSDEKVVGEVRGMEYPHILVQVGQHLIKVPPDRLVAVE